MISAFVSYSWDSREHKAWVARLAESLRARGVNVRLDQNDLRPGSDLTAYMESAVRESDRVLLVCTPEFAERADNRLGGVGYEQAIVTGEIFSGVADAEKFVPLLRGDPDISLPSFLRHRVWIDCRDGRDLDSAVEELLSDLPRHNSQGSPSATRNSDIDDDLRVYDEAVTFARSKAGFATTKRLAIEFAEECQRVWPLEDFRRFRDIFRFANTEMKLSRADSEDFASDWMERDDYEEFASYQRLFEFARSRAGLGLGVARAQAFVDEFDQTHGLIYGDRFRQAFSVARGAGRSRDDAEDFAFEQVLTS